MSRTYHAETFDRFVKITKRGEGSGTLVLPRADVPALLAALREAGALQADSGQKGAPVECRDHPSPSAFIDATGADTWSSKEPGRLRPMEPACVVPTCMQLLGHMGGHVHKAATCERADPRTRCIECL